MFIQTNTEVEGNASQQVANEIDHVMKATLGDRPAANGRQSTGPLLCARMLQEYMAVRQELINQGVHEDNVRLVKEGYSVAMDVVTAAGLTLCHAVKGTTVQVSLAIDDLHYRQDWIGAPMEIIDRNRLLQATQAFLDRHNMWLADLREAYKADSKVARLRNMAVNNMEAYLQRYFDGTGITYYYDKKHVSDHTAHLFVRLNRRKTLDLLIPHDDFIGHLDKVKPYMVRFAMMARDGHFSVRGEARDDWESGMHQYANKPKSHRTWLQRLWSGDEEPIETPTLVHEQVRAFFDGKKVQYHLTETDKPKVCRVHVRLPQGRSMIIDLNGAPDVNARLQHDTAYISELVELGRMFSYRLIATRDLEWVTAPSNIDNNKLSS